ncbi:hypothetical protein ACGFMM_33735 [Streptomyces sp. NPDC048604]|uniref:hypothetical protein n=1 Tax=Streptomyces sp. NPDC048604 TaxID=3365578 RepID=UPI00371FD1C2
MGRTGTIGRRALLTAGAAALAACSAPAEESAPKPLSAAERAARAELALRRRAVAASTALRERYDATLAAHPALTARLTPLRTSAEAHARALAEGLPEAEGGTRKKADGSAGRVTATPGGTPSATPPAPVPADQAAAVRELVAAARRTADAHGAALLDAPPEYARLLASVAAAAAAHAYLLTAADAPARSTR